MGYHEDSQAGDVRLEEALSTTVGVSQEESFITCSWLLWKYHNPNLWIYMYFIRSI